MMSYMHIQWYSDNDEMHHADSLTPLVYGWLISFVRRLVLGHKLNPRGPPLSSCGWFVVDNNSLLYACPAGESAGNRQEVKSK